MQWGGLYIVCLALCCLQTTSDKLEESRHYGSYQGYHHHEHHWGPYFEGDVGDPEGAMQVTAHVGAEALLNCRVGMLKDKTVMWLRRTTDSAQLLTVGPAPYAGDNRIAVKYQYPNNWRLSMNPVKRSDAGLYMCQISTHPPKAILANLTVLPPVLTINGDQTHELKDRFYKAGSSIKLSCVISDEYVASLPTKAPITTPAPTTTPSTTTTQLTTKMSTVFNRIDLVMNKSWSVETTTITSTVSVSTTTKNAPELKTTLAPIITSTVPPVVNNIYGMVWKKQGKEFFENISWRNMSATISVASASQNDSGTYTCHLQNHSQVIINVHVLIGENQAAVHHDTWNKGTLFWNSLSLAYITILVIFAT
ncbi:defective proboscis extension response 18 isoform X2 [Choristoneura fumiferana]|uniref:defective proboscis extension response 18 isoform X2 n=1 Tax=Choristoneura fumiferana TaxID=7141 RepID=UPI003D159CFE